MKNKILLVVSILLILVLIFAGCSRSEDYYPIESYSMESTNMSDQDTSADVVGYGAPSVAPMLEMTEESTNYDDEDKLLTGEGAEDLSEKIIYNVSTNMLCEDVELAVASITAKVEKLGGYVSYANTYNYEGSIYSNLQVRVPADELDAMELYANELGEVEQYTKSSDNITGEYYDIRNRLSVALDEEEQLLQVLDKAETIEEILLVRAELSKIQEHIESYKGRIRLWDSLVDYSTITFDLRPIPSLDTNVDDGPRLVKLDETWRAIKRGFTNTGIHVLNFFSWIIRTIGSLAIVIIALGLIALVVIVLLRRGKGKQDK